MKLTRSICSRDMKKTNVLDSAGKVVGKVGDLTFTFDGELKLSKFILAGSRWEELLEDHLARAGEAGLDPLFIRAVFELIHAKAVESQLDPGPF